MKEELFKLIKENPDLDIVVMASSQDLTDEYGYLLLENLRAEVSDIYNDPCNEFIYFDKEDVIDKLRDYLADNEEYINMSDKEYDTMCEEKAKDYFLKKAIIIWANS